MSIGYELQVTPIQQLCFYNAIANNGVYMKPQLVSELRRNGVTYEKIEPVVLRKDFLSPATIEKGRKLMEAVTTVGTGKGVFKHAPYKAAGKTGTARIYKNGGYLESAHRASFVGYFPADKPKYSCIVVINEAKVFEAFGGKVAAPVFRDLANILFGTELDIPHDNSLEGDSTFVANPWYPQILAGYSNSVKKAVARVPFAFGIQSDANQISVNIQNNVPSVNSRDVDTGIVPDVRGMGLTDAMYALESRGLKVVAKGYGKVVYQSILPGTKARHQQINIELR
jgi:cell division protein FtsI (penicillin-binding protein 3)